MKKIKRGLYITAGVLAVILCIFLYSSLSSNNAFLGAIFLFLAMAIVGLSLAILFKGKFNKNRNVMNSHTMVDSIQRVFKVVTAEGHYTDIIDFKDTKVSLPLFSSTKKALIIVKAKVQMGYDFSKLQWEGDEEAKTLKLKKVPKPEILSVHPEITYYNMENGLFNKFGNEDLNKIQTQCIRHIRESALKSDLPTLAAQQATLLIKELGYTNQWQIEGMKKLEHSADVG